ncbi:MAG: phage portal protein [Azospirillum sp.]|nr:phage portal protein [Azospirillum sp.]
MAARTDDPRTVAFNPLAPTGERVDALAELQRTHIAPPSDLAATIAFISDSLAEGDMLKARGQGVGFPGRQRPAPKAGMQSVYLDDMQINVMGDYFEKPASIGFDMLRTMVEQTPVLNAVIMTRIRQISRFCQPSEDGGPGFEIRHVDRKHKLTKSEDRTAQALQSFFQHCGWESKPRLRRALRRDSFTQFMAKLVRDSLTMDAAPIETEMRRDRSMGIDGLYAVDGATIRLCTEDGYQEDDEIFALQVVQGRVSTTYTRDQLIYEPRNPRTDVRLAGYGLGETELLVRLVTGFLNAMTHNINGFDQNAIPRGMLHLSGDYSTEDMSAFKRYWNAMVRGVSNAWSLPVMVSKDQESKASFEKFGVEFDEMMFAKWMTFLTSMICAIYGMAPDEINFESFSSQASALSGSDTAEKLASSKDKGLRPLMGYFEAIFSDFVVSDFSEKFCFRWVGLDPADEAREWEAKKLCLTVGELRAEKGYGVLGGPLDDAPLNPSLIGPWMQLQQAPAQGQDFGGQRSGPDFGQEDGGPQGDDGAAGQDSGQSDGEPQPGRQAVDGDGDFGQPTGQGFGKAHTLFPDIFMIN